jgi:hypothetical protein
MVVQLGSGHRVQLALTLLDAINSGSEDLLSRLADFEGNLGSSNRADGQQATGQTSSSDAIKNHAALVASATAIIKQTLVELVAEQQGRTSEVQTLRADVERLKKGMEKLESQTAAQRQRILLGQVAYTLDAAAVQFVFEGKAKRKGLTFNELRAASQYQEFNARQASRWEAFKSFLQKNGWAPLDIVNITSYFRLLRGGDAHGTPVEQQAVSQPELMEWVDKHMDADVADTAKEFIKLLVANFCESESKALSRLPDISAVVLGAGN